MQVDHLASTRIGGDKDITKQLCDKIDEKVDAYVAGELKHAAEAMSLLWEVSKRDKYSASDSQGSSKVSLVLRPCYSSTNSHLWSAGSDR